MRYTFLYFRLDLKIFIVPIYDGRAKSDGGFSFTDDDFLNLPGLPLYKNGTRDLPQNAVVPLARIMPNVRAPRYFRPTFSLLFYWVSRLLPSTLMCRKLACSFILCSSLL